MHMQPGEALGIAAQVAVTLAGFAGIVVVFRPESVHQWSGLDKLRLRMLLYNSVYPLAYSLFAIFLLTIERPPISIWRWCSGFVLVAQVPGTISFVMIRRTFSKQDFEGVTKSLLYPFAVLGIISLLLQLVNLTVWNWFWPFFAAICLHLVAAMLQFLRIVLLPPEKRQSN